MIFFKKTTYVKRVLLSCIGIAFSLFLTTCTSQKKSAQNLIVILVDTVRADHLGLYGHQLPTSPELDKWSKQGTVFENAFSSSSWTLPSFGSLYTGRYLSNHRAGKIYGSGDDDVTGRLNSKIATLPQILHENGFETAAIINNPYLHPAYGVARGFSEYDYYAGDNANIRRADLIVDRSLDLLDKKQEGPFFLLTHFFDPHMDYDPPPEFRGRFTKGYSGPQKLPVTNVDDIKSGKIGLNSADKKFIAGAYDEELLFVDTQMGRFFEGLKSRGLFENSIIFYLSDHGEEFFEHGGFEHGHTMYQELLHIPLIVWGPDVKEQRSKEPVSIVDLLPTALEALKIKQKDGVDGVSLWKTLTQGSPIKQRDIFAEGILEGQEQKALIRWPNKIITNTLTGDYKLFDLSLDGSEMENLAEKKPALLSQLKISLEKFIQAEYQQKRSKSIAKPTAETRKKLKSLGYL